jgi:uncharacterized C2H2 Zn-finger protein
VWKVEKVISKGDYKYALVPGHPRATKNGYVLEHRVVLENHLGRLLSPDEVVHHKDGNKKDNRVENLEALGGDHVRIHHHERGRKMVVLKCPECGEIFERRKGQTFLQKGTAYTCCSARCRGKLSHNIQLYGRTAELERAISENLVREYTAHDNSEQTFDEGMRRGHTPAT